ncbi:MAG TPA: sulfur carrier protein ThiS [Solirubrobacteraceae bacterium]|nr:sulfur carrier protein ThiS [Solirubrobacteraceae bacterium]
MIVRVNGEHRDVADGATVADVVETLDIGGDRRGVAVAVDAEVVPRGQWEQRVLAPEASVEVLTAIQGG